MKRKQRKWSDKDRLLLKRLWECNTHRNEIAKRFGTTGDAVAHMARHLGYKRNPRPIRWGKIRLDFQILTYRAVGLTRRQIAEKLGIRRSHLDSRISIIRRRADRRAGMRQRADRNSRSPVSDRRAKRACLMCRVDFDSTHPGHRICNKCKNLADYHEVRSTNQWMGIY